MIRLLPPDETVAARLAAAARAAPEALGLTVRLWDAGSRPLPNPSLPNPSLQIYEIDGGLLVCHGGAAALLADAPMDMTEQLTWFMRLTGLHTLYAAVPDGLPGPPRPLAWMTCPAADTTIAPSPLVHMQQNYLAVAQLVATFAGDAPLSPDATADFYAALCRRRNRGLVRVLAVGGEDAPDGCAVLSGPLPDAAGRPLTLFSDFVVRPACRGRGLGGALLFAARQFGPLGLTCAESLQPCYARRGWQRQGALWQTQLDHE